MACRERVLGQYVPRVTPGTRARTTAIQASPPALGLHGVVKTTCCSWPCADVAERRCPRNRRSRCSGAAWWTPGGAYIEHARAGVVTIHLARRTGARHIVRPRRPQPSAHTSDASPTHTHTHLESTLFLTRRHTVWSVTSPRIHTRTKSTHRLLMCSTRSVGK